MPLVCFPFIKMFYLGLIVIAFYINVVAGACQVGWVHNGTSCYYFSRDSRTWTLASASCRAHGAELVIIETQSENDFIAAEVRRLKGFFWFDGTDEITEGQWEWASIGEPFDFTNWNPGEPNDSAHHEDCLMTWDQYKNGGWNDVPCDRQYQYICERNLETSIIGK